MNGTQVTFNSTKIVKMIFILHSKIPILKCVYLHSNATKQQTPSTELKA